MAEGLEKLPAECGAPLLAHSFRVLNEIIGNTRKLKLTRLQHIMFLLADMMTWCEVGEALCHKAATHDGRERSRDFMAAVARLFSREAAGKVFLNGTKIAWGCEEIMDEVIPKLRELDLGAASKDYLKDMDLAAAELVK
jgi:alkylation response protein AidB-like acyl-CoA dehydrogenase